MRDANPIEEETCVCVFEDFIDVLHKYRTDPQIAIAVAIALIASSARALHGLSDIKMNDLNLSIALAVQDTVSKYTN